MATNRFGYSDDFVLKNGKVGINTTEPQEKLDVVGVVKGENLSFTGVSSFTTYEGFLNSSHIISESITLNENQGLTASLSGEIIVGTGVTVTIALAGVGTTTVGVGTNQTATSTLSPTTTTQSGQGVVDSLKVYNTFNPPVGGTNDRPIKAKPGQLYYNQDFKTIEFWDGNNWIQVDNTTQRGRGVIGAGYVGPNYVYTTDFVNISSTGNAQNFGTLTAINYNYGSCSSSIRGLFGGGGNNPSAAVTNTIEYITIASEGNSIDFGDLSASAARTSNAGCSSSTRGVFAGGYGPTPFPGTNIIDYVQISTLGNALDFGDLTTPTSAAGGCSSSTRGLFSGFINPGGLIVTTINAITISSTGNAVTFGNLTDATLENTGLSSPTRGIFAGGRLQPGSTAIVNIISYTTISTFGNSTYFGDLTARRSYLGSTSNTSRGVFAGGYTPTSTNIIDFITIAATGNAQDFGDLVSPRFGVQALSDSHGGLGGF